MKNETIPPNSIQTAEQIAEKALAATVSLEMKDQEGIIKYGSGFFVQENLIATNYHVREDAVSGTAKLVGKSTTYTIKKFGLSDPINDIALIEVAEAGIKPLSLGSSSDAKIGETVYVASNPVGLEGTFSDGIISSKRDVEGREPLLQITAPISQGSSGGPVLNRMGEVIGVAVGAVEDGQNLNFAIPSRALKILVSKIYVTRGQRKKLDADYKGALADLDIAIHLQPDNAEAYIERGSAKHELDDYEGALVDLNIAIRINPDSEMGYLYRARAKVKVGDYKGVIADLDIASRIDPEIAKLVDDYKIAKLADDYNAARQT